MHEQMNVGETLLGDALFPVVVMSPNGTYVKNELTNIGFTSLSAKVLTFFRDGVLVVALELNQTVKNK